MKQHEAVIQAMRENGGYATLGHLYQTAPKIPGSSWGTKTPFASIRRIVQVYPEHFFKIRPGLWALTTERERVLGLFNLLGKPAKERVEQFNHSYYQGLLLQIGNLRKYKTFVPSQDKNKSFLKGKLSDFSTLKEFPSFTYDRLLTRARTVDVTWFNERGFPYAFFEVEHSTDIRNSLQKFVQFQDFKIQFRIVADEARRREFERWRNDICGPILSEVKFLDYEKLSTWHSKTAEMVELEEGINL